MIRAARQAWFDAREQGPIFCYMVPGLNSNVERNGAVFHVQTEDLGRSKPILRTLVYFGGEVVTALEYTYEELATSEEFSADDVRRKLARQHLRLMGEIQAGIFDAVDPSAAVVETEEELLQREKVLDYLESALTYDIEPCRYPGAEAGAGTAATSGPKASTETEALSEAAVEPQPEAVEETEAERVPDPEAAPESEAAPAPDPAPESESSPGPETASQVESRVAPPAPVHDERAAPADEAGPRRLVVIRRDQAEPTEGDFPREAEAPQIIEVRRGDETPCAVPVRQSVAVKVVADDDADVVGVLDRLDENLEQARPAANPSHARRWFVVAATVAALVLVAAGWKWFSDRGSGTVAERRPAPVAHRSGNSEPVLSTPVVSVPTTAVPDRAPVVPAPTTAVPDRAPAVPAPKAAEPDPAPIRPQPAAAEPIPSAPEPIRAEVAPDEHGAPPASRPPVEEAAVTVAQDLAPAGSGAASNQDAAESVETAAKLTPPVPDLPTAAPDPLAKIEAELAHEATPEPASEEPPARAPKVRPGMLIDLAQADRVPEPTARAFPEYPKRARKKGRQGRVELSLLIDERGNVADIRLAEGVAESDLSDAAVNAARSWKYSPARKGRHAVKVWKPVTVHFLLDEHNSSRVRVEE